jgi:hypothetical protein
MRILNLIKQINILLKMFKSMFRIIPSKIIEFKEYYENNNKILEKISYNNSEYFFEYENLFCHSVPSSCSTLDF